MVSEDSEQTLEKALEAIQVWAVSIEMDAELHRDDPDWAPLVTGADVVRNDRVLAQSIIALAQQTAVLQGSVLEVAEFLKRLGD